MKRTKTLIASIFATVINAIWVVMCAYTAFIMLAATSLVDEAEYKTIILMMTMMIFAFLVLLVVALVLACCTFGAFKATKEKYAKKKGLIITSIVFNFIVMIYFFISLMPTQGEAASGLTVFMAIVSIALLLTANILFIVDLAQEKKRIANVEAQSTPVAQAETNPAEETKE